MDQDLKITSSTDKAGQSSRVAQFMKAAGSMAGCMGRASSSSLMVCSMKGIW
jgi:hypothetical protein